MVNNLFDNIEERQEIMNIALFLKDFCSEMQEYMAILKVLEGLKNQLVQNDFITGALGNKECDVATNVIADEIRSGKYDDVIFTRDTHDENYLNTQEGKKLPVTHCIKGTNGWEVDARLKDAMKERGVNCDDITYIDKPTFGSRTLAEKIAAIAAEEEIEVTLIGLCTDICVVSNALLIKAYLPEIPVKVVASCCAGVTPASHEAALTTMQMCQVKIENN